MEKKTLADMTVVELITICEKKGISYTKGNEILDAEALRAKISKKKAE